MGILKKTNLIILAVGLLVFGLCLGFDFVLYDDQINVLLNTELLNGNILFFWSNEYAGLYVPMVYTLWAGLHGFVGLNPFYFHGLVLVLHLVNACLVNHLLVKMKFNPTAALAGALLFLVHPLQVESVAWVTALKDTLFLFFALLSILYYFFKDDKTSSRVISCGFLILALLTKPLAVALVLFVILYSAFSSQSLNYWVRSLPKHWPLAFPFIVAILTTLKTTRSQGNIVPAEFIVHGLDRLLIVFDSLGFYILKTLIPTELYPQYMRIPPVVIEQRLYLTHLAIALGFILLTIFIWRKKISNSYPATKQNFKFAALWAVLFFLPTSGIIPFIHQVFSTTADRYMYSIFVSIAVAAAYLYTFIQTLPKRKFYSGLYFGGIAILGFSSLVQATNWKDNVTFYRHLLEKNPNHLHGNLHVGTHELNQKEYAEALKYFEQAQKISPTDFSPLSGIASVYFETNNYEKLDAFASEYLSDARLKTYNNVSLVDLYAIYNMQYDANEIRKKITEAEKNICLLLSMNLPENEKRLVQEKKSKLLVQLKKNDLNCP